MGLLEDRKKSQYLQMAEEKLQGLLNIPQQAQRFITNPTAFLGLLGQNPLPRESGFAAGATGLPPTEMSVLDPNQAPYMQGYGQGEPVGYAGMALPFAAPAAVATGRALAPKAGQALESYMVNQGLLQPLTAYHGTPHNIQGKFDINKVGTGEGAQAYGHGMYFAENPAVAKQYQETLGQKKDIAVFKSDDGYYIKQGLGAEGQNLAGPFASGSEAEQIRKALPENQGNLYKVDIPDADIPFMLDWDKPLNQQPKNVQDAFAKFDSIAAKDPERGTTYMQRWFRSPSTAKKLEAMGYKGFRYLDEGSRLNASHWEVNYDGGQAFFKSPEKAKEFMATKKNATLVEPPKGTSNFVVFDPSNVKILEQNSKPVTRKELIEKQVKALKE
jgi:hypothetical protein